MSKKWRILLLLALAEFLGMAVWFSASAVVPALTLAWDLDDVGRAWLTMSVQIGFVIGSFGSVLINLADLVPSKWLFSTSAFLAALCTALIPWTARGLAVALVFRFLTGVFLAGVYPVGMKIMTTWAQKERGFFIGLLVGALTFGSAAPHLLNVFGGVADWKRVMIWAAVLATLGGLIAAFFVKDGPYRSKSTQFNWKYAGFILRDHDLLLANMGYLGHMWELYAMWAWIPIFIAESFKLSGNLPSSASLSAFAVIGVGGIGSLYAGQLADKLGRTTITIVSLVVSGICSLLVGWLFGGNSLAVVAVCMVWGFAVVADSAQYSAAISELCQPEYTGTVLTMQTSMGFLLTLVTIRLVPLIKQGWGWGPAFAFLAIGPAFGIWAMLALRHSPAAKRLAGGKG